jgi:Putative transposase/Transposase zinc-binding domain
VSRPTLEVVDILREHGKGFIERNRSWLNWLHIKVLLAIQRCRTAALGGHVDECVHCEERVTSYNSCRNRHCPKCQASARDRWLAERSKELLPVPYVHVVFTLPHELAPLAYQNKRIVYDLLFKASAATLLELAADPKHLGAEIGFLSVLHTWGQTLQHHPHVHCVIPAGGPSADHTRWVHADDKFFLPVKALRKVFRGKFHQALKLAFNEDKIRFYGDHEYLNDPKRFRSFLRPLFRKHWIVYCKPPFGGPQYVLQYLARYTHRVAISNHRLVRLADGQVTFRWKDYTHGNKQKLMTLDVDEFLRRFLIHTLPRRFVRIRFFGFLARRKRGRLLPLCRSLLPATPSPAPSSATTGVELQQRRCPRCGGLLKIVERLAAVQTLHPIPVDDTS